MMNMGMRPPASPQPQGMDTSPQNADAFIQMLMQQQNNQGPQTTPMNLPVRNPNTFIRPNPNVGTMPSQPQQTAMFDQAAQPPLGGMARNLPPQTDNRALGPSSPLRDIYSIPRTLQR